MPATPVCWGWGEVGQSVIMYYTMTHSHMRPELWRDKPGVPVMVVASNYLGENGVLRVRAVPTQCRPLFADCGGFYFALKGQDYPFSHRHYIDWLTAMQPDYAACMDYPCEAEVAADDAAVLERQCKTLAHASVLLRHPAPWQWVPVLQGRTVEHYLRHADLYQRAGLVRPYMGIGSLCRRTRIAEITAIVRALSERLPGTKFHLFGVKSAIFRQRELLPHSVASADSAAWNGMFGQGRLIWKEAQARGLSQREFEVHEALPRYQAKVVRALRQPKQMTLLGVV